MQTPTVDARRLLPLGLGVTALLVVAGIASHGRPLSGASRGTGPTAVFFDYVWTTVVLLVVAMAAVVVYTLLSASPSRPKSAVSRFYLVGAMLMMFAAAGVAILLLRTGFVDRLKHAVQQEAGQPTGPPRKPGQPAGKNVRNPRVRWDETGVVLVLLAGGVVVLVASRAARRARRRSREAGRQRNGGGDARSRRRARGRPAHAGEGARGVRARARGDRDRGAHPQRAGGVGMARGGAVRPCAPTARDDHGAAAGPRAHGARDHARLGQRRSPRVATAADPARRGGGA